jgi:hypothetical protein
MSDEWENDKNLSFSENINKYRSELSNNDRDKFDKKRHNIYWQTLIVCISYALIAIIILLLGSFTESGNRILFGELFAFVLTYIAGTILIIIYLAYMVYYFANNDELKKKELGYDSEFCPDYWNSQYINNTNTGSDLRPPGDPTEFFPSNINKEQVRYRCLINDNENSVYKSEELYNNISKKNKYNYKRGFAAHNDLLRNTADDGEEEVMEMQSEPNTTYIELPENDNGITGLDTTNNEYSKFKEYAAAMSGYSYAQNGKITKNNDYALKNKDGLYFDDVLAKCGNSDELNCDKKVVPLVCDKVYPLYMSVKDYEYATENELDEYNKFRCAYSKSCGVPWSEAGCY